jgi:phage-related protein
MSIEDTSAKKITHELFKMQPDAMLEFFEINFSNLQADFSFLDKRHNVSFSTDGDPVYRFTSNVNGSNAVWWQGKGYQPLPVDAEGFEVPSDGRLPRPKLRISNPSGLLSSIVAVNYDFHGCKVTRKRTFAKFLDDKNFPDNNSGKYADVDYDPGDPDTKKYIKRNMVNGSNPFGSADPNAHLPDEVYYVHRKTVETKEGIEFELSSILEVDGVSFPGRQLIADHCTFRYRDPYSCGYRGAPVSGPSAERFASYGIYQFTFDGSPITDDSLREGFPRWDTEKSYAKGDVVQLPPSKDPEVPAVFVCIRGHSSPSPSPASSAEHWVLDACSKTLMACTQRFGCNVCSGEKGMRYGGFPSVENFKHA